jgi:hypothetical protein
MFSNLNNVLIIFKRFQSSKGNLEIQPKIREIQQINKLTFFRQNPVNP